jgi:hypothetical protein
VSITVEEDPMSMKFEELVQKVMRDEKFRTELKNDPAKALQSVGVKATPELEHSLRSLDWASIHKVNDHYKAAAGIST